MSRHAMVHRRAAARRLPRLAHCGADPLVAGHEGWQDEHDRRMVRDGTAAQWQVDRVRERAGGGR